MKKSRQLLSIVIVFFWASEYCHVPYFTPYLNMLGFSVTAIGFMVGTYGFTQMIVRIPLGIFTDVAGAYKGVVLAGTLFTTLSSFGLIFAKSMWFVVFCRFLAGIAASTWIAFTVLYSAYYQAEEGVQAMANVQGFNNGGKLLAFALGTITASIWGYRVPLVMSFLTGLIAVFFALQLKTIPIRREPMQIKHIVGVFCNPSVLLPSFFAIVMQLILHATVFSFTSTVAENLGASAFEIGLNTSLFTVIQVLAAGFVGKKLVKRIGEKLSIVLGFVCLAVYCLLVAAAGSIWVLYLAQLICGIGNLLLFSILAAMAIRYIPQENKSTAMGLFQALYGIGMTIGPLLISRLAAAADYRLAYLVLAGISGAALLLAAVSLPWLAHHMEGKKVQ